MHHPHLSAIAAVAVWLVGLAVVLSSCCQAQEVTSFPFSFDSPKGLCVDSSFAVYVTDFNSTTCDGRVLKFSNTGELLGEFTPGLSCPYNIYCSTDGSIWVGHAGQSKLVQMTANGVVLQTFPSLGFPGAAQFMTLDTAGNIYVVGPASSAGVYQLDPTGSLIQILEAFSDYTESVIILVDASGSVYLTSHFNQAPPYSDIYKGIAGNTEVAVINVTASVENPVSMALDANSHLIVTDLWGDRLVRVDQTGALLNVYTSPLLFSPWGVAVDSQGSLYTLSGAQRVVIFRNCSAFPCSVSPSSTTGAFISSSRELLSPADGSSAGGNDTAALGTDSDSSSTVSTNALIGGLVGGTIGVGGLLSFSHMLLNFLKAKIKIHPHPHSSPPLHDSTAAAHPSAHVEQIQQAFDRLKKSLGTPSEPHSSPPYKKAHKPRALKQKHHVEGEEAEKEESSTASASDAPSESTRAEGQPNGGPVLPSHHQAQLVLAIFDVPTDMLTDASTEAAVKMKRMILTPAQEMGRTKMAPLSAERWLNDEVHGHLGDDPRLVASLLHGDSAKEPPVVEVVPPAAVPPNSTTVLSSGAPVVEVTIRYPVVPATAGRELTFRL